MINGTNYDEYTDHEGKTFHLDRYLLHAFNYITLEEEFFNIEGFERFEGDPPLDVERSDGLGTASSAGPFKLYYTRNQHKINLVNPMKPSDNREVSFYYEEDIKENDSRMAQFGAIENVCPKDDDHYWFYDEACTDPVDFTNLKMPNHDMTLYAGLKRSYYVKVYPDGGELLNGSGKPGNNYSTWFRLDEGETITPYVNVTRDYIAVDTVPEGKTAYVYEEHLYSDEQAATSKEDRQRFTAYKEATSDQIADSGTQKYIYAPGEYAFIGWFSVPVPATITTDAAINDYVKNYEIPENADAYTFTDEISSPVILKAKWRPMSKFTIVYDAGDAHTPVDDEAYVAGSHARVKASIDQPEGKQFRGWQVKKGDTLLDTVYQANSRLPISDNIANTNADGSRTITLVAKYDDDPFKDNSIAEYKFLIPQSFNSSGAVYDPTQVYYLEALNQNETLVTPNQPPAIGDKSFVGWYADAGCTRLFTGFGKVTQPRNTIIYAKYAKVYTVTYYDAKQSGGDWVKGDNILVVEKYEAGDKLSTAKVSYAYDTDRYVDYWHVMKADGTTAFSPATAAYQSNTEVTMSENLVLWPEMEQYKRLMFDSRGGSYVEPVQIPTDSSRWPNRPEEPTKKGHTFKGWFTKAGQVFDSSGNIVRNGTDYSEYEFDKPLSDVNGFNGNTLYAWWVRNDGATTANYIVVWEAQTNTGENEYEFLKAETYEGTIGSTVNILSSSWISENGDPRALSNMGKYYTNGESQYFQYASHNSEASVYGLHSIVSGEIKDDGSTVLRIRFDRQRYWFAFDTNNLGDIHYGTSTYNESNLYFIQVWLNKDIADEWPVTGRTADGDGSYSRASLVMDSGKKYNAWKNTANGSQGTMQTVANKSKIDGAVATVGDKEHVLKYTLDANTGTTSQFTVHYIKGTEEDMSLQQTLDRNWSTNLTSSKYGPKNNHYFTQLYAKDLDGYSHVTSESDVQYASNTLNGYNAINEDGTHVYTEFLQTGTSSTSYSYTLINPNRQYYEAVGYLYFPITIRILGNGMKGGYRFYYTDAFGTHEKTSGDFHYVEDGGTPLSWGLPGRIKRNTVTVSWGDVVDDILEETKTTNSPVGGTHLYAYYKPITYTIHLLEGNKEIGTVDVDYDDVVANHLTADLIPDQPDKSLEFSCWSTSQFTEEAYPTRMPSHDLTLFLHWREKQISVYTVGYDENGNAVPVEQSHEYKGDYNANLREFNIHKPIITELGTMFSHWEDENGIRWSNYSQVTETLYLYAKTVDKHVASPIYDYNGGSLTEEQSIPGTQAVTGETGRVQDSASYMEGAFATVKEGSALKKNDMAFAAWNTKADGKGDDYYPGDLIKLGNEPVVLYARYVEKREVTLVYHLNGGSRFKPYPPSSAPGTTVTIDTAEVTDPDDSSITETVVQIPFEEFDRTIDYTADENKDKHYPNTDYPASTDNDGDGFRPFRTGYNFLGWNTNKDAAAASIQPDDTIRVNPLNADENKQIHLYAVWDRLTYRVQITDGSERLYYYENNVYQEAQFHTIYGAHQVLENLYKKEGDSYTPYSATDASNNTRIEVMVSEYIMEEEDAFTWGETDIGPGYVVTLTSSGSDPCVIRHGDNISGALSSPTSMIRVGKCDLTLANITLDGENKNGADGAIAHLILENSKLTVGNGATLRNGKATAATSLGTSKGGAVYALNGECVVQNGAVITGCSAGEGGAIYLAAGAELTMSGGSISGNTATTGAGIYVNSGTRTTGAVKISGNPSFGGTTGGNFPTGSSMAEGSKNGGTDYTKAREDIYLAGSGNPLGALVVTGAITGDAGSIWVWASQNPHYKEDEQFAIFESAAVRTAMETAGTLDSSLKVFRNAQPDSITTETGTRDAGDYLFGVPGTVNTSIYWGGDGLDVIFKKTDGFGDALAGATFTVYREAALTNAVKTAVSANGTTDKDSKNTVLEKGIVKLEKIPNGVYYMKETLADGTNGAPAGYAENTKTYIVLVGTAALTKGTTGVWTDVLSELTQADINDQRGTLNATTGKYERDYAIFQIDITTNKAVVEPDIAAYGITNEATAQHEVILRKVTETSYASLENAKFRIFRANMTEITDTAAGYSEADKCYKSLDTGVYFIGSLPLGRYYLVETATPDAISGTDAEGNPTSTSFGEVGKVFTLEVKNTGVSDPTASTNEISVAEVEGKDMVPENLAAWVAAQTTGTP